MYEDHQLRITPHTSSIVVGHVVEAGYVTAPPTYHRIISIPVSQNDYDGRLGQNMLAVNPYRMWKWIYIYMAINFNENHDYTSICGPFITIVETVQNSHTKWIRNQRDYKVAFVISLLPISPIPQIYVDCSTCIALNIYDCHCVIPRLWVWLNAVHFERHLSGSSSERRRPVGRRLSTHHSLWQDSFTLLRIPSAHTRSVCIYGMLINGNCERVRLCVRKRVSLKCRMLNFEWVPCVTATDATSCVLCMYMCVCISVLLPSVITMLHKVFSVIRESESRWCWIIWRKACLYVCLAVGV